MSSPSSCLRCSRPAALLSPLGLCPSCAATDGSAAPTPRGFPGATCSALTATATARPDAATATAGTLAAPAALPQAPPGYELLERLGRGGMGSVYLARDSASERLVAMKFLHHPGDAEALERFLVELRVLALFDHPGIVRVLSSDFLRASPFFTMEYAPGGSLSRALDSGKPMPVAEAVRLIRAVAEAVAAAHAKGVVHRDLKPSNVLLTADGTVKVSDFGLAKRLDTDDQLTRASGTLGTASYMPPEQVSRKNGEVGKWSDVYGLGATFYHLLTGRPPFRGDTTEETVLRLLSDPPERPRAIRPDIPMALEAVVLKCLEKDPKDRYACVAEFLADLDRYEAGLKPDAPQLTRRRRLKRWARQNRRALAGAACLALLGAAAFGAVWAGTPPTDPRRGGDPVPGPVPAPPPPPAALTPFTVELAPEQAREDLRHGKPVVLVGATAPRTALAWGLGSCDIVDAKKGDTRFSLRSRGAAVLQILPDPVVGRYRLRAELRQDLRVPIPGQKRGAATAHVGIVVGHARARAGDDSVAHALLLVGFNEHDPAAPDRVVGLIDMAVIERPLQLPVLIQHAGGNIPLAPVAGPGADWRELEVEAGDDGVTLRHAGQSVHCPAAELRRLLNERVDQLRRLPGCEGVELPAWSARSALGIWVSESWVSVRNVMLQPIP